MQNWQGSLQHWRWTAPHSTRVGERCAPFAAHYFAGAFLLVVKILATVAKDVVAIQEDGRSFHHFGDSAAGRL